MVFLTIEYVNKAEILYLVFTRYDPGGVFSGRFFSGLRITVVMSL